MARQPAEPVRRDPRRGDLAERLARLARTRRDVPTLLADALASGPLPTEVPADALWWRVASLAATRPTPAKPPAPRVPVRAGSRRLEDHQRPDRDYGPRR